MRCQRLTQIINKKKKKKEGVENQWLELIALKGWLEDNLPSL